MRIICVADTHLKRPKVAEGDVLIHAGDLTVCGTSDELCRAAEWLSELPHAHKLIIAGNHDLALQRFPQARDLLPGTYLEDSGVEIEGVKFWGAPWLPYSFDGAFGLDEYEESAEKWSQIPTDTQVLITHTPPFGILDSTYLGFSIGCRALRDRLMELPNLQLCVFGHVHSGRGFQPSEGLTGIPIFVNAACGDERDRTLDNHVVVDLNPGVHPRAWLYEG